MGKDVTPTEIKEEGSDRDSPVERVDFTSLLMGPQGKNVYNLRVFPEISQFKDAVYVATKQSKEVARYYSAAGNLIDRLCGECHVTENGYIIPGFRYEGSFSIGKLNQGALHISSSDTKMLEQIIASIKSGEKDNGICIGNEGASKTINMVIEGKSEDIYTDGKNFYIGSMNEAYRLKMVEERKQSMIDERNSRMTDKQRERSECITIPPPEPLDE